VLREADCFVAISSEVAEELMRHGVNPSHVRAIPNCVDTRRFCPPEPEERLSLRQKLSAELVRPLEPGEKVVTFVGRLVAYKGLPLLVRVWREFTKEHRHVRLLLVGAGGDDIHNCEAELRAYLQTNGLWDTVHLTGDVLNVPEYLKASDAFVLPTENEAFGLSLVEAMACGLPVLSTPVGGVKDIVEHRQNGLLVEAGDFRGLYDAMQVLLTDAELVTRLGQAALRTVQERYAMDVVVGKYSALFRGLLGQDGAPPAEQGVAQCCLCEQES
jgi:glycosyltransferase involved in cell wall biosynthesis